MYEAITYEILVARMLEKALELNKKLDSREGSLLWYGQAPAAVELQNLYIALDTVLNETFADTATRPYLIQRAAERGLVPEPASAAVLQLSITPVSLTLEPDARFSIGDLNYFVSGDLGGGNYEITCETAGEIGNDYGATVIPIEYIPGLETCVITALLVPGENEEDTEVFRQRYFDSMNFQAFGGNVQDYTQKVKAIPGVGGVKVYRAWNSTIKPAEMIPPAGTAEWINGLSGVPDAVKAWLDAVYQAASNAQLTVGGTVKVVVIDSTYSAPSPTLIENVQTTLDPTVNAGEGVGLAPIGHVVYVSGVKDEVLDLSFALTYDAGYAWADVEAPITAALNGYFRELAEDWEQTEGGLIVRVSQLETRILAVEGVVDIANTKINGSVENCTLEIDMIPALGTLTAV